MRRLSIGMLLMLLLAGTNVLAQEVKLRTFDIVEENRDFIITWQMERESGIRSYELKRRTPYSNNQFVAVHTFTPHGPDKQYQYRDTQVYKSAAEQVDYQLEVVYQNGLREIIFSRSLNYTSTAVRRTWGSIKAMFQ